MSDVKPMATGSLEATPLSNLLVYVLDRQLDGTLVLEDPARARSAIWFDRGAPAKVKTAEPVIYLGRLLLELEAIDQATHDRSLTEVAQRHRLHGQVLLAEGAIDDEALRDALREQVARKVLWMFRLSPQTLYGFYERQNFLARYGGSDPPRASPLNLIWRCLREYAPEERVGATLARFAGKELKLHPDSQVARFHFAPPEQAVVDVLRAKPQKLSALLECGLDEPGVIRNLIYTLAVTRHLDLGVPGSMPVGVDEPASSSRVKLPDKSRVKLPDKAAAANERRRFPTGGRPSTTSPTRGPSTGSAATQKGAAEGPSGDAPEPARSRSDQSPEAEAFTAEIRARSEELSSQDYYALLGVSRDAPAAAIRAAFLALAKKWHPDRLGPGLDEVREHATRVFAKMTEGYNVLSDEGQRAEYDAAFGDDDSEEHEQVQRVLRAATNFQKAEVLLKKHDLVGAAEHVRLALEDDPGQADYVALSAWIEAQAPGGGRLEDLIDRLDQAVAKEPKNERARYYRGQLLKRTGQLEKAIRDFRWVVDRNPKHLEATREIRLYEMRKSMQPGTKSSAPKKASDLGGFLKKVFKR